MSVYPPAVRIERTAWRAQDVTRGERAVPAEVAVAFTYNGGAGAVMMATPADLEDFAVGFSLTEGIISAASEIEALDVIEEPDGIELRMRLSEERARAHGERRRYLAGPTGCGLCGIESLTEAMRAPRVVGDGIQVTPVEIMQAVEAMAPLQRLNRETRAVHGAAFWRPGEGIVALREDVGRHNALDKLCGALARKSAACSAGVVLLTSRVSVEMVQKTAAIGASIMVAVSAPTALAIRMAQAAGITLVAVARSDGFEVFTHPQRVGLKEVADVA